MVQVHNIERFRSHINEARRHHVYHGERGLHRTLSDFVSRFKDCYNISLSGAEWNFINFALYVPTPVPAGYINLKCTHCGQKAKLVYPIYPNEFKFSDWNEGVYDWYSGLTSHNEWYCCNYQCEARRIKPTMVRVPGQNEIKQLFVDKFYMNGGIVMHGFDWKNGDGRGAIWSVHT